MKRLIPVLALFCSACAATPAAIADEPAVTDRSSANREWSDRDIQDDVERSVRERFGQAALTRATAAEAWIMSKLYRGMPLPPVRQPDGSWKQAPHPVALMVRENGRWLRADANGFAPAEPAAHTEIETLLGSVAFWAEPSRVPQGGCTDGGSTLFLIRLPGKQPQVRQGTCGGPILHSRLISAVY